VRRSWALLLSLSLHGCADGIDRKEQQAREAARSRAEELLSALRNADWSAAARFVYLDGNTRARMGITDGAAGEEAAAKIETWFRAIYGTVRPGSVRSVTIVPGEPARARVSYRHDDLDAFTMLFVNGDWFYVVD
jgi:hypothetical protein